MLSGLRRNIKFMCVPDDAFVCDLSMFLEKFKGVGACGRIILLVREHCGLLFGKVFQTESAVNDREDVVGRQIIWIDGLDLFIFDSGQIVFMELVVGKSQFAMGISGSRKAG